MSLHVPASIKGRLCLCMCLHTLKAECISAFVDVYQLQSWYLHILPSRLRMYAHVLDKGRCIHVCIKG